MPTQFHFQKERKREIQKSNTPNLYVFVYLSNNFFHLFSFLIVMGVSAVEVLLSMFIIFMFALILYTHSIRLYDQHNSSVVVSRAPFSHSRHYHGLCTDGPFWVVSLKNDDDDDNSLSLVGRPKTKFIGITGKFQYDYHEWVCTLCITSNCVIIIIVISRRFHHNQKLTNPFS